MRLLDAVTEGYVPRVVEGGDRGLRVGEHREQSIAVRELSDGWCQGKLRSKQSIPCSAFEDEGSTGAWYTMLARI